MEQQLRKLIDKYQKLYDETHMEYYGAMIEIQQVIEDIKEAMGYY